MVEQNGGDKVKEFILEPLSLLFARGPRMAVLAVMVLLSSCSMNDCTHQIVVSRQNIRRFIITTSKGRVDTIENPESGGTRSFGGYKPTLDEAFPVNPTQEQINNPLAGVNISVANTLFGLSDGEVLQLEMPESTVVRSLQTGFELRYGVASPNNEFLYLLAVSPRNSSTFAPSIQIVNTTTFQLAGSIALPTNVVVRTMTLTPNGKFLYVAGAFAAQSFTDPSGVAVHIIDTTTRAVVKTLRYESSRNVTKPEVLASPDGGLVFLTIGNGVAVIDALTQTSSHTIPTDAAGEPHIAVDPTGTALYVAPMLGSFVTNPTPPPELTRLPGVAIYDIATSTLVQHVPVDQLGTMAMALSLDGRHLFIDQIVQDPVTRLNDFPVIKVLDLGTNTVVQTIPWTGDRSVGYTVGRLMLVPAQ